MVIYRTAPKIGRSGRKVCLAIGFFDGVHLGHQQIIRQTIADARKQEALAVVVSFDQHPNSIVAPSRIPPLIYSLPQKIRAIRDLGTDGMLLIHFDKPFSEQSGEVFVRGLVRDAGMLHSLCVGDNFAFGNKRSGNVDLLQALGRELHFVVRPLKAVSLGNQSVSSTRIREAVAKGDLDAASQMLGRAYSLCGKVVHGDHLGQKLGFPTANLDVTNLGLPPNGVYTAHADIIRDADMDAVNTGPSDRSNETVIITAKGEQHRAVVNIGVRPTISNPTPHRRVEAHLLGFSGDLYGAEVELRLIKKLRDEQKFSSMEALRAQIGLDVQAAEHSS